LPPKHEKCGEIPRGFDLTAVQGHPRSSILVSILCDFLLVINIVTLAVAYLLPFSICLRLDRKLMIQPQTPTPPLFDATARGNPLKFLDETYSAKTRAMGLPYGENFIIVTSTVFL